MRSASGHQCKVKMRGSEKKCEREHVRHFLQKTCNWKFHVFSRAKRPIVIFSPFSFPSPLGITRFYILFQQTLNIIESFAFSPG